MRMFLLVALSGILAHAAPGGQTWIIAARRTGTVELVSPSTLQTVARVHVNVAANGVGLNGVYAGADGSTIYVEGPSLSGSIQGGCCFLFSIDLTNFKTKIAAGIWGSPSREHLIISDGTAYPAAEFSARQAVPETGFDQTSLSPDRKLLFGVRMFHGPALDVFDLASGRTIRSLSPQDVKKYRWACGTWMGNRFYFYAEKSNGVGRLWTMAEETTNFGNGVAVPALPSTGCRHRKDRLYLAGMIASKNRLFLYERFGTKLDRRRACGEQMPGGAWLLDPATGRLASHVAPDLHFARLLSNPAGSELYGLTSGHADSWNPVLLVRIDPISGQILQSRKLETDYWWMTLAQLRTVPRGEFEAIL